MVGFDLNKKDKIKSYIVACIYGLIIIINIVMPTFFSLLAAVLVFWLNFFRDSFFVGFTNKTNNDIEKTLGKKGLNWILAYLLAFMPFVMFYFHTIPMQEIENLKKFVIALAVFLVIITTISVKCVRKFQFVKMKMYKACTIVWCLITVYFGFVFCEANYFLDFDKATIVVEVEEMTGYGLHTNFYYFDTAGKKQSVTTYKLVREDFQKILLQTDEGAFGIVYKNVFDEGIE